MTEGFLLDTNIVSETRRSAPYQPLIQLLAGWDSAEVFVSVLTLGELHKGAEMLRLTGHPGASNLRIWINETEEHYQGRILPVDDRIAHLWGIMSADRTRPVTDTLLAATARTYNLAIVTRNQRDFSGLDIEVINPWTDR